jgi:superfamily II DNA or RNA helicase
VALRGRHWLVQDVAPRGDQRRVKLACIEDDAQGERLDVVWEAEIAPRRLDENPWSAIGTDGTDDLTVFGAYLRTIRWNTATAANRKLLQAPFRAGIRLDPYQLLPLRKALELPRVNLLIADDVGLGKTVEAGLILRELLLRRRIDFALVAAPASMTLQWEDELRAKFGLAFKVIDRDFVAAMRRTHGFGVNVWRTGAAFIVSHSLLIDEAYTADLRAALSPFRPRSLLILDEAHHAAPSSGSRYATDSQFTAAMRGLAPLFEHRLFLSATPHNGHSNSFSALLAMLDPQRFTRGVPVEPKDCEPVMVRRLKSDLRELGAAFPKRDIKEVTLEGLPPDAPELELSHLLSEYESVREERLAGLPPREQAQARIIFSGLQQRLLSSVPAFLRTLEAHRRALERHRQVAAPVPVASLEQVALPFALRGVDDPTETANEEADFEASADDDAPSETEAEAATELGATGASAKAIDRELQLVDRMLAVARESRYEPDARARWLAEWIRTEFAPGGKWSRRRLIVFTEWTDTLHWLKTCVAETIGGTDRADDRIAVITGRTDIEERERIKLEFNEDPDKTTVRVLLATDAAREGINLQAWCADLLHFDLPWNPARLEQRNGRIDRKLQAAPVVTCRYFRYAQRPEDVVLRALVRKTDKIREQLGTLGQVIAESLQQRMGRRGIARGEAEVLAREIEDDDGGERLRIARVEMDDDIEARRQRLKREKEQLERVLEESREAVGVNAADLEDVVGVALERMGVSLPNSSAGKVGETDTFRLDPAASSFVADPSWTGVFDELRRGRPGRIERLVHWRQQTPVRAVAFEPPIGKDGRDDPDVVQLHIEHRLVRRLLSRFVSQGFQSSLQRVTVVASSEPRARIVLLGRLCLFGADAQRLHEHILSVSAFLSERTGSTRLSPFGADGDAGTLGRLDRALREGRRPSKQAVARATASVRADVADLMPELETRSKAERQEAERMLRENGVREADSLRRLLEAQRKRILEQRGRTDTMDLFENPLERRQRLADRRSWEARLAAIDAELLSEPQRVRAFYDVAAARLEPVGVVYLMPGA